MYPIGQEGHTLSDKVSESGKWCIVEVLCLEIKTTTTTKNDRELSCKLGFSLIIGCSICCTLATVEVVIFLHISYLASHLFPFSAVLKSGSVTGSVTGSDLTLQLLFEI